MENSVAPVYRQYVRQPAAYSRKSMMEENISFYGFGGWDGTKAKLNWDGAKTELKKLCQPENWGPNDKILHNYVNQLLNAVLKQYLKECGEKHDDDYNKGIFFSYDGDLMWFDTGLYTNDFKRIFGFCDRNLNQDHQLWFLQEWQTRFVASKLNSFREPEPFKFFKEHHELHFNPQFDLQIDTDHMLESNENHDRVKKVLDALNIVTTGKPDMLNRIKMAVENMKIRVKQNSRTVVPQFYGDLGLQLLLPLSFGNDNAVQLVIPVTKIELDLKRTETRDPTNPSHWRYVGRTVLDMSMAYNNARLLNRLESEWLQPPVIDSPLDPSMDCVDDSDDVSIARTDVSSDRNVDLRYKAPRRGSVGPADGSNRGAGFKAGGSGKYQSQQGPNLRTVPCKFYIAGNCTKGSVCTFKHEDC
jgi:hypothetical protein